MSEKDNSYILQSVRQFSFPSVIGQTYQFKLSAINSFRNELRLRIVLRNYSSKNENKTCFRKLLGYLPLIISLLLYLLYHKCIHTTLPFHPQHLISSLKNLETTGSFHWLFHSHNCSRNQIRFHQPV